MFALDSLKVIVLVLGLGAVLQDLLSRRVANQAVLAAFLILILSVFYIGGWGLLLQGFLSSTLVLLVSFLLWRFGVLGAGDVKVMVALALTLPWSRGLEFVFYSLCWGAIMGLLALLIDKNLLHEAKILNFHPILTIRSLRVKNHKTPFTVAILLGILSSWLLDSKGVYFL
jgi:prepilin peptidase CpaA